MAYTTALNVSKWFLARNRGEEYQGADGISNLKLQKLLYYAQGCVLAITNEPLFGETIHAWQHGPVVDEVYHHYKSYGSNYIDDDDLTYEPLSDEINDILESVYQNFGQFSAWKLRDMTHEETPWMTTEKNASISIDKIKKYFKENYINE